MTRRLREIRLARMRYEEGGESMTDGLNSEACDGTTQWGRKDRQAVSAP